jgi:hypothetical protein
MASAITVRRSVAPPTREGYLASHFRALEGLRLAPIYAVPLLFALIGHEVDHDLHGKLLLRLVRHHELLMLVVPACLGVPIVTGCFLLMPQWYLARYGFVAGPYGMQWHKGALKWGMLGLGALFVGCLITSNGRQLLPLLTWGLVGMGQATGALITVCIKLPPIASVHTRRWFYIGALVACVLPTVLARATNGISAVALLPAWLALLAASLYDHWLLGHLARPVLHPAEAGQHAG